MSEKYFDFDMHYGRGCWGNFPAENRKYKISDRNGTESKSPEIITKQ